MNLIKEATQDLHTDLENLQFNQKMFRGQQTEHERKAYILCWKDIFQCLDPLVPDFLRREDKIEQDLLSLSNIDSSHKECTKRYCEQIKNSKIPDAHIYLNYMGFLYGGQIMRKRYPSTANLYDFENLEYCRTYIRENHVWPKNGLYVEEVRSAFRAHINMSQQLGAMFNVG